MKGYLVYIVLATFQLLAFFKLSGQCTLNITVIACYIAFSGLKCLEIHVYHFDILENYFRLLEVDPQWLKQSMESGLLKTCLLKKHSRQGIIGYQYSWPFITNLLLTYFQWCIRKLQRSSHLDFTILAQYFQRLQKPWKPCWTFGPALFEYSRTEWKSPGPKKSVLCLNFSTLL